MITTRTSCVRIRLLPGHRQTLSPGTAQRNRHTTAVPCTCPRGTNSVRLYRRQAACVAGRCAAAAEAVDLAAHLRIIVHCGDDMRKHHQPRADAVHPETATDLPFAVEIVTLVLQIPPAFSVQLRGPPAGHVDPQVSADARSIARRTSQSPSALELPSGRYVRKPR